MKDLKIYSSEEMLKKKLPRGCFFHNIAKVGQKPRWIIEVKGPEWAPDPNDETIVIR